MSKIIFTIGKDGVVTNEVEGVVGNSCDALSLPFIRKLGGEKSLSFTPKEEYYKEEIANFTIEVE